MSIFYSILFLLYSSIFVIAQRLVSMFLSVIITKVTNVAKDCCAITQHHIKDIVLTRINFNVFKSYNKILCQLLDYRPLIVLIVCYLKKN